MYKCEDCKYFYLLERPSYRRTTYCKYGNKTINIFTNKTLACKNFKNKHMSEDDKLTAINAHRRSCPQWNCCKLRIGKIICTEECEYVRRFVKLINE